MRLLLSIITDGASESLFDKDDSLRVMRSVAAVTTRLPDLALPELNSRRVIPGVRPLLSQVEHPRR